MCLNEVTVLLTEGHKLRPEGNGKHDKVEDLNHLQIGVGALRDENRADVEEDSLGEVDERAGDTVGGTFNICAADAGGERLLRALLEFGLEDALETH